MAASISPSLKCNDIYHLTPPHSSPQNGVFSKVFRRFSLRTKSYSELERRKVVKATLKSDHSLDNLLVNIGHRLSNVSRNSLNSNIENESLYRGLLQSLLHPLGHPDVEIGLRPGDLIDHLREEYYGNWIPRFPSANKPCLYFIKMVFEIDREDHEYFIGEELQNRPQRFQVNITLMEARNLHVPDKSKGQVQQDVSTYGLLTVYQPYRNKGSPRASPKLSPRSSPKVSPKVSPKNSPTNRRPSRNVSVYCEDVLRSQAARKSLSPIWNEEFVLEVEDLILDELHVCLCHQDPDYSPDKQADKSNVLKNFFKNILQTTDHDRYIPGCIGRIIIPIREIPNQGWDTWFDVFPICSMSLRSKPVGQCHLRLALSYKQDVTSMFTPEDYHKASLNFYTHADKLAKETEANELSLPTSSRRLLDIFAVANRISKLSQNILDLTVLLELSELSKSAGGKATDSVLHKALEDVQMTWLARQAVGQTLVEQMPLSDTEVSLYRKASKTYIKSLTDRMDDLPSLFPPSAESLITMKSSLGLAIHLLELDMWDSSSNPQKELSDELLKKLQSDIELWLTEKLDSIQVHDRVKDSVIPRAEKLADVISTLVSHCSPLGVIKQFYSLLGVNYYRVVAFSTDRKVTTITRELMMEMDKYQLRYHNFPVNISKSSRLSLNLYFSVRNLYQLIRDGLNDRDMFRLSISQYQSWFQESLVFWLQTFKTECMSRMEKALEIDKDMVVVTSLVKFSNSSVDVLSCFAMITEEWHQIGSKDPDSTTMGVTKITDLICDGARLYADKIHSNLKRNCYYDTNEAPFDVTDRVCITLNNIEHVRQYLNELPELLEWNAAAEILSISHEDENIGKQSLATLHRLINTAQQDILHKSSFLLQEIAYRMKAHIQKQMETFLIKLPEKVSSVDSTIQYLSTNLETLQNRMSATIYPNMLEELWGVVLLIFDDQMLIGRPGDYYDYMKKHLNSLSSFFLNCGLAEEKKHRFNYDALVCRISDNCLKTENLMLAYFKELADNPGTPIEYLGHLAVKTAFVEETKGKVTIYVKVVQATDLPGLDPSGLSDPYVIVSLQPHTTFETIKPQKTKVMEKTLQPVFNATFTFTSIPKEYLSIPGTTILMSVLDYDCLTSDDFAGEVLIHLNTLEPIDCHEQIDSQPAIMMPLKRPECKLEGPFKVLQERCVWDKAAKSFISTRRDFIKNQPQRTDKPFKSKSYLTNIFSFFGLQNNDT